MLQRVDSKSIGQRIVDHTLVVDERSSSRQERRAHFLNLSVRHTDAPSISHGTRRIRILLGLHNLIEDGVDIGGGHVSGVTAVVAQGYRYGAGAGRSDRERPVDLR